MRRAAAIAVAVLGALALIPSAASAATARTDASPQFAAKPGEQNKVTATQSGASLTIRDNGAPIEAGQGCTQTNPKEVVCQVGASFAFDLGDGDDTIAYDGTLDAVLAGGDGNDSIQGGANHESLLGGAGDDQLDGGGGDDLLTPGLGDDSVKGGTGRDRAVYDDHATAVKVTLGAAGNGSSGENDTIAGDVEDLYGTNFADELTGDGGPNEIFGALGGDRIAGAGGNDTLHAGDTTGGNTLDGGDGDDTVDVRETVTSEESGFVGILLRHDDATCGAGTDTALGDFRDTFGADCETIDRGLQARTKSTRMSRSGRIKVRLRCGSPSGCRVNAILRASGLTRVTAWRRVTLPANRTSTVTLRASRKGAALIRRRGRLHARLVVYGNPGLASKLTVRAPR